jgi:hypothetical protein
VEIKVDRRIGYVLRAFAWKGRIDQARAFGAGIKRKVEVAQDTAAELKLWGDLLFKEPEKKKRRRR